MDKRTLRVLEYNKIVEMLAACAVSEGGRQRILAIQPQSGRDAVARLLSETGEAEWIVIRNGRSPIDRFRSPEEAAGRAAAGAILGPDELLSAASFLKAVSHARSEIHTLDSTEGAPKISGDILALTEHKTILSDILRCIDIDGNVTDEASAALAKIRRSIQRTHQKVRDTLQKMISSPAYQKYLQEPIVTQRSDRYVLPVKQEHKNDIKGMVHDRSATGATLFVEPSSVVELNNQIRQLGFEEQEEIQRILSVLSNDVAVAADSIRYGYAVMVGMDVIFARALFSRQLKGVRPEIAGKPSLHIIKGRHPLIEPGKVVPVSLEVGEAFHQLVVTGPNTGGKTVSLKMAGLFALMAQSGLFIPAEAGSRIGVFKAVYADIGDEQAIEQSLSTFSSHMTHIARIMERADDQSLVLMDELGAGTDPAEGAALATAILTHLKRLGACTIATTHYSELKHFALVEPDVQNASMEFDLATLSPTYRMRIGLPGKSNAFEISRKLGLSEDIIDTAQTHLDREAVEFEDLLKDLTEKQAEWENKNREIESTRLSIRRESEALAQAQDKIQEKKDALIAEAREEAREILRKAKETADKAIAGINRSGVMDKDAVRAMEAERADLRRMLTDIDADTQKPEKAAAVDNTGELYPGRMVELTRLGTKGQVLSPPGEDGTLTVQAGIMKVSVRRDEVKPLDEKPEKAVARTGGVKRDLAKSVSLELDVRGQSVEDARVQVDLYLDDASINGLSEVSIIHGKGTGALRQGIRQFLKTHPHVKSYRTGTFGEGESGVTIVSLK